MNAHEVHTNVSTHTNSCGEYKIFKELTYESAYFIDDGQWQSGHTMFEWFAFLSTVIHCKISSAP